MLKLHFFPTGIDMISIEVQTSQPYAALIIFAADFAIRLFFCLLCFVCIFEIVMLWCRTNICNTGLLHEYQPSFFNYQQIFNFEEKDDYLQCNII